MTIYKPGDLVRVSRVIRDGVIHCLPFGVVATVVQHGGWSGNLTGRMLVDAPDGTRQSVALSQIKPAKQATKKRAAYAARRGGPFEIPTAIQPLHG